MATKLSQLQDRAAAIAATMDELAQVEERTAEQNAEIDRLSAESQTLDKELAREHGTAFVMVTHDEALAARCGRQLRLVLGKLSEGKRA